MGGRPLPSLFCFSVMQTTNYEVSLVRTQLARGSSIFACDDWAVFTDVETWLSPGPPVEIISTPISVNITAGTGEVEHILNTKIFVAAWDKVLEEKRYLQHQWVVKVDPDAVFLPPRLRVILQKMAPEGDVRLYVLNCNISFGFYGALEVVSSFAVWSYGKLQGDCLAKLPWEDWGEDLYMRKCMDLIGVPHASGPNVLADAYCGAKPDDCTTGAAAFHPFKAPETYFQCLAQAEAQPVVAK